MEKFFEEIKKLYDRYVFSKNVPKDYYEPGRMEYLEQNYGEYDSDTGRYLIRFEAKGTRYEGRTEQIEKVLVNDKVEIVREEENVFNSNNFTIVTEKKKNLGNMPAELCNAIAPLYDKGMITIDKANVSYVEPISKRSRHAKQPILFIEVQGRLLQVEDKM